MNADDIRDIRPPVDIPIPWMWIVWALIAMIVIAAIYFLWKYFKSRKKIPPKLPHEIALEKLEMASQLIAENLAREFSFEVSEIVRIYIENRFNVRAANRTTEEFLHQLLDQNNPPLAAHQDLLKNFLDHCDLAKFGRWALNQIEMKNMLESAKSFIITTASQPEEQAKP